MRFWASTAFTPPDHDIPLAKAADEAGIHWIVMSDHIFFPRQLQSPYPYSPYEDRRPIWEPETPWPDVWVTVGAMAAVTTRISSAPASTSPPPGICSPWPSRSEPPRCCRATASPRARRGLDEGGVRPDRPALRPSGQRLDEMMTALRVLWGGGWVEHHGEHDDFGPLQIEPAPTRPVPIWCGGHSEPAMRRAALLADGWVGNAYSEEDAERYVGRMRALLAGAGRADEPFEIIIGLYVPPTPSRSSPAGRPRESRACCASPGS